jgi:hypothetical protein
MECVLVLRLTSTDLAILNHFRGELPPSDFISLLLRIIDSGRVITNPLSRSVRDVQRQDCDSNS